MSDVELFAYVVLPLVIAAGGGLIGWIYGRNRDLDRDSHPAE
ncbi:hypothetical protein [Gellertiella hungarica]|uniref:Uncharacterized protein n=1 Tax=Gellertiella hungarica TaxID=1572859 RepID=A0A7W6J618_9HYPH|nr:hypothetical protein [Gellertiella hungarica]MBB4064566.1 hypothetical protein [Gellertiella hungarica]